MTPPKTRQVLGARQRAKDSALIVLNEEYGIRPKVCSEGFDDLPDASRQIASIPLSERDIIGDRIGKTCVPAVLRLSPKPDASQQAPASH
jgi:hypothetical protein